MFFKCVVNLTNKSSFAPSKRTFLSHTTCHAAHLNRFALRWKGSSKCGWKNWRRTKQKQAIHLMSVCECRTTISMSWLDVRAFGKKWQWAWISYSWIKSWSLKIGRHSFLPRGKKTVCSTQQIRIVCALSQFRFPSHSLLRRCSLLPAIDEIALSLWTMLLLSLKTLHCPRITHLMRFIRAFFFFISKSVLLELRWRQRRRRLRRW